MEMIIEMFSYPFMVRAFTVGALVARWLRCVLLFSESALC